MNPRHVRALKLSVGVYIARRKACFTPLELAQSMGKRLGKPETAILDEVIELCKKMVDLGYFRYQTDGFTTAESTLLSIARAKPFQKDTEEALLESALTAR